MIITIYNNLAPTDNVKGTHVSHILGLVQGKYITSRVLPCTISWGRFYHLMVVTGYHTTTASCHNLHIKLLLEFEQPKLQRDIVTLSQSFVARLFSTCFAFFKLLSACSAS